MENTINWSFFTLTTPLKASGKDIIKSWSSQEELEKWFLRSAVFHDSNGVQRKRNEPIQIGDTYKWMWFGHPDSVTETGVILKPEKNEFIRFVFGKAGIVSISLETKNDYTIITLKQENIPLDEQSKINYHVGCKTGWTYYFLNLKSILYGGLDLRNKDITLNME